MKDNKPLWSDRCEMCFGCINYCPQSSIQFGKKTVGKKRYHNPNLSSVEMIKRD